MILFDTNVLIYAFDPDSEFSGWARGTLKDALAGGGASINPVILAELCVGDREPETVELRLAALGMHFLDLKVEISAACAEDFGRYLLARRGAGEIDRKTPLPDFFIGAHASVLGLPLATVDTVRYRTYFPSVKLICP